ncbi:MAG: hypothetical protein RIG77_05220 [Cyclobacteriaceae bacterium]
MMKMTPATQKIWLFNKPLDLMVLLVPVWLVWVFCFSLPASIVEADVPLWVWVVFVLGIDVAHVWSTIFRTYLDKEEFGHHKRLLIYTPVACLVLFFFIASISIAFFWTVLAYVALYHFIKQQYGFMQLYRARFGFVKSKKWLSDKFIIYLGMLYPVWYWHLNSDRNFSWFVDGDFFDLAGVLSQLPFGVSALNEISNYLYFFLLVLWFVEEEVLHQRLKQGFPIGKWLWIMTTWGNWYLGIVYFNSDIVFTVTNVVAHGVPYMALVFFYVEKKRERKKPGLFWFDNLYRVGFMLGVVLLLAFGEEYLWDMLLYQERTNLFEALIGYPTAIVNSPIFQALALALLSVPQATHYVLDGFIWKANSNNPHIKTLLLN